MKNVIVYLFVAALAVSFAACSGGKKAEKVVEETRKIVDSVAVPVETIPQAENPAEALKAFEAFAKEYAEAFNNLAKDPQKFQKLGKQVQEKVADLERQKVNFDKKQEDAYKKALELISKVNRGGK
jgi:hypothetical protein